MPVTSGPSGSANDTAIPMIQAWRVLSHHGHAERSAWIAAVTSAGELDGFVAALDYPMYVVTTRAGHERAGCLVGFTTQTSIDPQRFLVCISKANATARTIGEATHVAVHLLAREAKELARLFGEESEDWTDKFAQCDWHDGPYDVPVLDAAVAWFVGEITERLDVGDHTGLLLSPVASGGQSSEDVLTFQQLKDLDPGHPA
jgi:flavin reductase (DIM6/NTAB) family NADH-FMN oxidoreductase RutF